MKLYELVRKIMNGSTVVMVDDAVGNMIEAMFNFVLISHFQHKFDIFNKDFLDNTVFFFFLFQFSSDDVTSTIGG